MNRSLRYQISIAFSSLLIVLPAHALDKAPTGATAVLAVLETSDLHANVVGYDYYKLAPEPSIGVDRTATLIKAARKEFANTLLLDNGDTIQGTAFADYQALVKQPACGEVLGIYKIMNALGYEGGTVGNHEFNYGLPFLNRITGSAFQVKGVEKGATCAGPAFPIVLANVTSLQTKRPLFAPYQIIDKKITARGPDGKPVETTVKVGIIGFTPPDIMSWDKRWLEGRVAVAGVRETAEKYIPEMRKKGAQLIVALSHGGLDDSPYSPKMENANWHLAKVPGVDVMLLGHAHQLFPNAESTVGQFNLPGVDKVRGLVHGVPAVMPSQWGKHLGVVQLHLTYDGKAWSVDKDKTVVQARATQTGAKTFVEPDAQVAALVKAEHEATIAYVKTPVGRSAFRMTSYFADVGDPSALEVVNRAQAEYVSQYVKANLPQYATLPVLSVSAPFKAGFPGVTDYTDVPAGDLALNNAADLYLFPNSLYAVKVDGAGLKAWLETAAQRFNTIDPALSTPQELVNARFPSFNFDTITSKDVAYEIDVTKKPGERIVELTYLGKPVTPKQEFLVATNNYRASGGGGFPGLDGGNVVIASPDNNRDILIAHIRAAKELTRASHGAARSWRFARVETRGPVVFHSAPDLEALAREAGLSNVSQVKADDGSGKGTALYAVDLSK
ncbi:bifunctional 2',3'-cyclic-nucleotide 2'-phosphodiesterase/3'-nucleotidase [Massilia aurea]|uniref:bifunctional 2',3'-cyclic-nucleotide 2'-phosphodiesterase/3'-nucleotidase n=1 Tax=Massilia aurea TaxID=373040 RepID=UPI003461BAFF